MKSKTLVAAVLAVALIGFVAAPPAQAELVTITVVLAASFATFYFVNEGVKANNAEESSEQAKVDNDLQAKADSPTPDPGNP